MKFLTDFADQAVVLPLIGAVACYLALLGRWRAALLFLLMSGGTFGVMLVLKLGFLACSPVFSPWSLHSPSGHASAAAVVAGGLAVLLGVPRAAAIATAILAAAVIGLSRVVLGAHSVPEAVLGGLIGTAGVMLLSHVIGPIVGRGKVSVLLVAAVVAVLLHGLRLPAEAAIRHASRGALDFVPACRGK